MVKSGILNPKINSLLSLVRHTNTLVIADRGFPFWKEVETVDISLVDDIPRVLDVLAAIRSNFNVARAFMAEEFNGANSPRQSSNSSALWMALLSNSNLTSTSRNECRMPSGSFGPVTRFSMRTSCWSPVRLLSEYFRKARMALLPEGWITQFDLAHAQSPACKLTSHAAPASPGPTTAR